MLRTEANKKILYIFELNGVLGHASNLPQTNDSLKKFYDKEPDFIDGNYKVWNRPNLHYVTNNLLIKQKDTVDVGIWS